MAQPGPEKPAPPPYAGPTSGSKPQGGPPAPKPLLLKDKRPTPPAKPGNGQDIIGGTVAAPGEFPYFVSVQTFFGRHFCGGSLLSTTKVLTAAHCVDDATPPDLRVSVGGTTLVPDNGVIRFVSAITVHPSWDPVSFQNDVAILTLTEPILRSDTQAEWLRLARGNELGLVDHLDPAVVMGHGCCAPPDPNDLLRVTVPIQNDTVMSNAYRTDFDPVTMMGAGSRAGGQDACSGDSGGPLVVAATPRPVQIGDVSWGNGCALPNFPGVYGELYQGPLANFVNGQVFRPGNDEFNRCQTLGGNSGTVTGTTENATADPGETGGGEASVWYCWTPTVTGNAQITINQHGYDSVVDVWTGSSVTGLSFVVFNDDANGSLQSEAEFAAVAGRTYRIRVDGFLFDYGDFRLSYAVARPPNDDFAAAEVLSGATISRIPVSNTNATGEAGEPAFVFGGADATLWYSWTSPDFGPARCGTHGTGIDTTLAAYTGPSLTALATVASNDDTNGTFQSQISFPATAGTEYRIQVGGFGGQRGVISLQCTVGAPEHDLWTAGRPIGEDFGTEFGSTARAIGEPGEPVFLVQPYGSVWFRWTAPYSGNFLFDTCGSDFDTVLSASTGTVVRDLLLVAVNDDTASICPGLQSVITFTAQAGAVYHISVNGFHFSSRGELELHWVPI